ncbi:MULTISPECIES: helix-turn-helix domain-containing protein [unclassified Streptomyces]|uniref:AraC-like ligand-binding domain-containing protein n=1 Tax=unclassified Streptomyces TaxID=2593676 RepID=UPI002966D18D|nr:helix-turn-helix domain-containing protein [Streptomyces sp. SJL17-1]
MNGITTVSTTSVGAHDGFEWWSQMVGDAVMPVAIASPYADRFRGTATAIRLTDTEVSDFAFSPMTAQRAAAHIRRADPEQYFLVLVHGGPIGIEQRRNNTLLTAGDLGLFDTSHPLSCEFQDDGRLSHVSLLRLPRATLPLPQDRVDQLLGTALPARTGSGALLASYLTGLRAEAGRCEPEELRRLGAVALALSVTFLAARTDSPGPTAHETRHQVLLARVRAFIEANLADPGLGPDAVAAHHHISVRLLHVLFRDEPETVGATIRRLRLERSRADLANPGLGHRRIGEIAERWGFRHQADYSRAFRRAYGMPPSDFRRQVLPG